MSYESEEANGAVVLAHTLANPCRQQSVRGECAVDGGGTCGDATELEPAQAITQRWAKDVANGISSSTGAVWDPRIVINRAVHKLCTPTKEGFANIPEFGTESARISY